MSATAIFQNCAARREEPGGACRILILHEDFATYARAVEVCRRVMAQFADELDFEVKCCSCAELADADCARYTTKVAGAADVILVSLLDARLPEELHDWLDHGFQTRFRVDGVLALVLNNTDVPSAALEQTLLRLNLLAGRLGMDFVSLLASEEFAADELPWPRWESLASSREIPERPAPDHWGLNE
jgi:hypothetical protein